MKCIAIDDEPVALQILTEFCKRAGNLDITCFSDASEGIRHIAALRPDIVFMDIEMGEYNGLNLAASLPENSCLILTTAYLQYAVEGFNLDAVDFLHKPFSYSRFQQAVAKAERRLGSSTADHTVKKSIVVKQEYNNVPVNLDEILYVEAMENYTKIRLKSGKVILAHNTMKHLHGLLPEKEFVRIHRSYIVPLAEVDSFTRQNIKLKDGTVLPVGRQFAGSLLERFS